MNKKLLIFDLDGTLADTSEGIINCHKHAHEYLNKKIPSDEFLYSLIGGPLLKTYIDVLGFNENEAREAVDVYRKRYKEKGVFESKLYPNMDNVLDTLKRRGYLLAVATLKAETLAIDLLNYFNVAKYFAIIKGVDPKDNLTKSDLIELCISKCNVDKKSAVLIGDSIHDYNGASAIGVDFIAATYGFDFKKGDENLIKLNPIAIIDSPTDLLNLFN